MRYDFDVTSPQRTPPKNTMDRETLRKFNLRYPHSLQLPNTDPSGPPSQIIRFNAAIDTIFMDVPSLRALHGYSRPSYNSKLGGQSPARSRIKGFNLIQRLAIPHPDNKITGIDWLKANVLTDLQYPISRDVTFPPNIVGYKAFETRMDKEID